MKAVIVRIPSQFLEPSELSVEVPLRLIMELTIVMMMTKIRIMMMMMMMMKMMTMTTMMMTIMTTARTMMMMMMTTAMKVLGSNTDDYDNVFSSVFHGCSNNQRTNYTIKTKNNKTIFVYLKTVNRSHLNLT